MGSSFSFQKNNPTSCNRLVIFGATGDVTSRLFLPSLAQLVNLERLPKTFSILAVGRQNWSTTQFRQHLQKRFEDLEVSQSAETWEALFSMMEYEQVSDVGNPQELKPLLTVSDEPLVMYLALPPSTFEPLLHSLEHISLPSQSRIIFEKPFGVDLQSAQYLNGLVHKLFGEEHVFRLDHFLGKQTVQNILRLRFANRFFEPIWNQQHIERVEITWDETKALEGRASYYDKNGALKDMIQNHLLQLLCLIGMEPPISLHERDFRDRKVDLLRSVRHLTPSEVKQHSRRARYDAGSIDGRTIPAYIQENGVDPEQGTETFAEVTLWVDNWRWAGVPFTLRSGKALAKTNKEIAIFFRSVPHLAFGETGELAQNVFRLRLSPDSVGMLVNLHGPEDPEKLQPFEMTAEFGPQHIDPYGQLFLDVIKGDPTLFIRGDEAEELWKIVSPILEAWETKDVPLVNYPAGSSGPPHQP
jgi:glucose-6-phosphate 1-dehydrogenase